MFDLFGNINKLRNIHSDSEKKKIAKLLQTTPEALEEFEKAYHLGVLEEPVSDNLFEVNAKQAAGMNDHITVDDSEVESLIDRIVTELLSETTFFKYEDGTVSYGDFGIPFPEHPVTKEEILSLPESLRPQLSGTLLKKELNGDSYPGILSIYKEYLKEKNPQKKKMTYDIFRQGLEIQDLDPITYQIIAKNKNSIGHWFPELTEAVKTQDFFKIPNTTIIQVPLPLLQLTKLDYMGLTKTSLEIADRFCEKAFSLDRQKEYFIKTGVFSSKYDFRNAHIQGAEEVRTIGEYLLFIHFQASSMDFDFNWGFVLTPDQRLPARSMLFSEYINKTLKDIQNNIIKKYMDELDLSGIDFTDYIKRRCIKKTREYIIFPKLDPFTEENLYKFSNLKFSGQDAADLLTGYLDLESYIYDQLDECYEDLLLQKLEYYTITKYLKDPVDCGVITEDELKLIHALNQINDAKSVKVMWNYHGVKFENKMEIEKIRLKMNNCNDFYHEWDFPTSRQGENIINSLKQTLLSEKQIRVKTEHISAIYYRGKEIFSK